MKKTLFTILLSLFCSFHLFADNLVSNGDFELGTTLSSSCWFTSAYLGVQTVTIDNTAPLSAANSLKIAVATTGGYWSRLTTTQYMTISKASTYTVTFKAKASANCVIRSAFQKNISVLTFFGAQPTFNLTTSTQTFTYDITTTTTSTGLCKFGFFYGDVAAGTTIYIDDVTVVEKKPLTDRNLCNGDFEIPISNTIYVPSANTYNGMVTGSPDNVQNQLYYGWSLTKLTAGTADVTAVIDSVTPLFGAKSIRLTSVGTPSTTNTDAMFSYLFGGQKDKSYTISFKAKASADCSIYVGMFAAGTTSTYLTDQTCNLTTAVQTFTYSTTLPFSQPNSAMALSFKLGKLPKGVTVWLDDVSIVKGIPITSVAVTPTPVTIAVSSTFQLGTTILPLDATNQEVTWSSSDATKATVSATGLVTALSAGTTTISATSVEGAKVGSSAFTISATPVAVTGLSLNPSTISINKGVTQQLSTIFSPIGATNKTVTWHSDNTAIATVDASGLVTGVNSGITNVTATSQDGSFVGTASVSVAIPMTGISITPASGQIAIGTPYQLSPVFAPLNATNKTVTYSSNKISVATVSSTGLVTGLTPGVAIITVTTQDGSFTSSYSVTVSGSSLLLPNVLSNNMVMQQNMMAAVWGWTAPNTSVAITASWGQTASATADATGKWSTKIQTPKAVAGTTQTKHTLAFAGVNNTITLTNILIGDVYLCNGQSNMGYVMNLFPGVTLGVLDYANEIAAANYPNIRINRPATNPQYVPLENSTCSWNECTAATVSNFSAVAYYFARELNSNPNINIPIGVIAPAVGGSSCQSWTSRESLAADSVLKTNYLDPSDAAPSLAYATASSVLFNGMLAPLIPFSLKGFLWYQGEANANSVQTPTYGRLNSNMIKDWRGLWGQGDIPFYFVQLPAYSYFNVGFRDQQCNVLTVPNTAMAVTLDLADADLTNIHPRNKKAVAKRLARIAEAKLYGQNVVYLGPTFKSKTIEAGKIRISYHPLSIGSGLASRDGLALNNFKIAGSDNVYVDATAVIDGNDVLVSSPSVVSPVNVSFAYTSAAIPNLMNKDSLTACQFRTDTWNNAISFETTSTANEEVKLQARSESVVNVYPVPATDLLHVDFQKPTSDVKIELIDLTGSVRFSTASADEILERKIDVSNLNKGIYLLRVVGGDIHYNRTIVIK